MNGLPPRPANTIFGIRSGGQPSRLTFQNKMEAEWMARDLAAAGRWVEIFDKVTGQVVKEFSPGQP